VIFIRGKTRPSTLQSRQAQRAAVSHPF
jgi:hypothetical protein